MKATRFEDLLVWQKAKILVKDEYKSFGKVRDYSFRDQIDRAVISIMNNIAEGFERRTNPEFIHFLFIAKGSAGEVRSMLYVGLELDYIDSTIYDKLIQQCEEVSKMLSGLIKTL